MTTKRRILRATPSLPTMLAELAMASVETIFHRSVMAATGQWTAGEHQRMFAEKLGAAQQSAMAAMVPGAAAAALLAPWHKAARSNSRRLRRK